jgi:uncharacterized protein (TIGR02996 family)
MIDTLTEHESFLRAIFDAPDDDTPRLVYADFLDENGEPERAALIRAQCERARGAHFAVGTVVAGPPGGVAVRIELVGARSQGAGARPEHERGFPRPVRVAELTAARLADPTGFRAWAVRVRPEYFGAVEVKVTAGPIDSDGPFATLFGSLALARVTRLVLQGQSRWTGRPGVVSDDYRSVVIERVHEVVITPDGVGALAGCPGARRLTALDLTHNNLDDAAGRALARSPHLVKLKRLHVHAGNRIRGRARQQLLDRFGPAVVG